MLRMLRLIGGAGVRFKLRRRLQKTLHNAEHCQTVQQQTLSRILNLNRESDFSKEHLSGVRNEFQFRQQLPITDYSFIAPYVERLKQGEQQALLGAKNQLLMFTLTSGTTSDTKYIPVTSQFLKDYRHGWQSWGVRAFDAHPILHQLNMFQLCSDYNKESTPGGSPCGNISGLVQHMQPPLIKLKFSVPEVVQKIEDAHDKYYIALLKSIADPDVGLLTTANPSTLIQLAKILESEAESLIQDLRDGTCSKDIPKSIKQQLRLKQKGARSKILDQLYQRHGKLNPKDIWPDLSLLAVWTGGSAAAYLPQLKMLYGDLPICDHGLSASEGRMTIPLEDNTSSGLLDIESHYFEFVPVAEINADRPLTRQAHELEVGEEYFILLTTVSGLYRYDIRDVVECTGFLGTTPLLKFLHKGAHISSLTGEKITETQVVCAVGKVADAQGLIVPEFILTPAWGDPPHYLLLMPDEVGEAISNPWQFAVNVDQQLQTLNCEYSEKRSTGRLEVIKHAAVNSHRWQQLKRERQSGLGGSAEQYKHPFLLPELDFAKNFLEQ